MDGENKIFQSKEGSKMGKDHHHNKLKYKTNPKLMVKKPAIRKLPSNHEHYDETDDGSLTTELFDKDFKRIAELPTSQGSYFQEENEYLCSMEKELNQKVDFLNLDLKLFNLAMKTIPFYDRIGLDPILIKNEKEKMDTEAEKNLIVYKKYLEELTCDKVECTLQQGTDEESATIKDFKGIDSSILREEPNQPVIFKETEISSEKQEIVELENWLDDLLN